MGIDVIVPINLVGLKLGGRIQVANAERRGVGCRDRRIDLHEVCDVSGMRMD